MIKWLVLGTRDLGFPRLAQSNRLSNLGSIGQLPKTFFSWRAGREGFWNQSPPDV